MRYHRWVNIHKYITNNTKKNLTVSLSTNNHREKSNEIWYFLYILFCRFLFLRSKYCRLSFVFREFINSQICISHMNMNQRERRTNVANTLFPTNFNTRCIPFFKFKKHKTFVTWYGYLCFNSSAVIVFNNIGHGKWESSRDHVRLSPWMNRWREAPLHNLSVRLFEYFKNRKSLFTFKNYKYGRRNMKEYII